MYKEDLFALVTCSNEESSTVVDQICEKYNCSREAVYWNFRSVFGEKLRNVREQFREPNREEFLKDILISENSSDLRLRYHRISASQWAGIFDRVLGVSTFAKAKELALMELLPVSYVPTTDNNVAMWAACRLGDGSFDAARRSWKIEHCAKQIGWLEKKVTIFKESFPQCSTKITHNEKRDTYSWYSGAIGSGKFYELGVCNKEWLPKKLNHFGLWWLFLDDGCYSTSHQQIVSYATENMMIATSLAERLRELGHQFRVANEHCIVLTSVENVIRFHKDVLEPFAHLTPDCMKYKTTYKKI